MMSSSILTNTHQKNKILQLLPETYLKRAYDIIPYNDYYQPLVSPMYDKSPVCILTLNPFYDPTCEEIILFRVQFVKRCRTRRKLVSLMINKLPLCDEIKNYISTFIGLKSVMDMFGTSPYI